MTTTPHPTTRSMHGGDLVWLSATEHASLVRDRRVSPGELVDAHLERIAWLNPGLNAYVLLLEDQARQGAAEAEAAVMRGDDLPPLHGVPLAVKDTEGLAGTPTTAGSAPLAGQVADVDGPVVGRLRQAGAIALGKTNTPEFGHNAITDNRLFGPTASPLNPTMNASGSSGGSAAAVAAGMAAIGHGSDGGGSIRIPASTCGLFGVKASWGRVPNGMRPDAFVHTPMVGTGPLTRTVEDAALVLDVIAGAHHADPYSFDLASVDHRTACSQPVDGLRVAYCASMGGFAVREDVAAVIADAARLTETLVAGVDAVDLDLRRTSQEITDAWMTGGAVMNAGIDRAWAAQGIRLLDDHQYELTDYFADSVELGRTIGALRYTEIGLLRTTVFEAVEATLSAYDLIIGPTLGVPGVPNATDGTLTSGPTSIEGVDVGPVIGWVLTHPFNFTGHPAASVPVGRSRDGVPIGLQVVGRRFRDDQVIAFSAAIERARPWAHWYQEAAA